MHDETANANPGLYPDGSAHAGGGGRRPRDSFDQSPSAADVREKQRYAQMAAQQQINECKRPGLRERVNSSFYRAERETRNVDRLKELAELLDTNPAIARILELIEQTGV